MATSGRVTGYQWDFGDHTTSVITHPVHVYTTSGVYTVSLTASGPGGSDTLTRTNYVTVTGSAEYIARVITYTYDPLSRLTGAFYSTGEQFEYAYDEVGNRTAYTVTLGSTTVTTYTYDAANRLTAAGDVAYTWDARGNLTNDGTFTYTYNAAGRLVGAQSLTATLVYTYTADGLRVAQRVADEVTEFAWDWATGVPEMLSEGGNLYLVGHETLGRWDGAAWAYYLSDALGSVRQVADGEGEVVDVREWTPYGVEVGAAQAGLGYTGEWWDSYIRFTYLRARWYGNQMGRFTSPDPIVPDFRNPQSINGYVYVLGNPIGYTDPEGLVPRPLPLTPLDPRDLTDWLYREMVVNAQGPDVQKLLAANRIAEYFAADAACDVMNAAIEAALDGVPIDQAIREAAEAEKYQIAAAAGLHAMALYDYARLVKNGARWDFKDEVGIKLGPGITLCPGVCYNGIEFSVPGNIHFAYVGVVAGFPGWEIQAGAGVAEIIDPAHRRGGEEYTGPWRGEFMPWPAWDPSAWNLGDEPIDHEAVTCGIKMAERYRAGMTRGQFEAELAGYISRLARCTPDSDPVLEQYARDWPYPVGYFSNKGNVYIPPPNRCP